MWPSILWLKKHKIIKNQVELELNHEESQEIEIQHLSADSSPEAVLSPNQITSIKTGAVAKIPIILAKFILQLNMESTIQLPEPALKIQHLKKGVKLTQSIILQETNMLFLKGFIRKSFDYITRSCINSKGECSDSRQCIVDVPFSCTTPVIFNGNNPQSPIPSTISQFKYKKKQPETDLVFSYRNQIQTTNLSELNQITTEYYNEKPYCELVNSRIVEFNEYLNLSRSNKLNYSINKKEFTHIEEKLVVFLTLKILQNGQVKIQGATSNQHPISNF